MDKIEIKTIILTFFVWFIPGFDLILLTLLSVEIQKSFFPNVDETVSILAVYGTLSLSLLARVFGGLYFSRIADTYGRKPVVMLCLLILSITTILSAYIPSIYQNFAPLSNTEVPLLFILSRIVIGFFIGGIWPTAAILGLEIISKNKSNKNTNDSRPNYWKGFRILREYKNKLNFRIYKNLQNFLFKKIENDFNKEARKLTGKSALMQIGYFSGYLIAAVLYYTHINKFFYNFIQNKLSSLVVHCSLLSYYDPFQLLCNIKMVLPDYSNF